MLAGLLRSTGTTAAIVARDAVNGTTKEGTVRVLRVRPAGWAAVIPVTPALLAFE